MAKRQKTLLTLFSLFLLVNFFTNVLADDVNYKDGKAQTEIKELSGSYTLKFDKKIDMPPYVKVILTPHDNLDTPTFCYSPTDKNCINDRVVLASRVDKKPVMACVKKEEIPFGEKSLNVLVTCKSGQPCKYDLLFEGQDKCEIDASTGLVYSYVVTKENQKMEFDVFGNISEYDIAFLNIGVEGGEGAIIEVEGKEPEHIYYDGAQMVNFQIQNSTHGNFSSIAKFTLDKAKIGDFLRLTVYLANNAIGPDNLVYPGGPSVMGVVLRNYVTNPEICLPISALVSDEFKDVTQFYLTGKIYSKYALYWLGDENAGYEEGTDVEIVDYISILVEPAKKKRHLCFEYTYEDYLEKNHVLFSVRLVPFANKKVSDFYFTNPPLIIGQTHRQMLTKEKTVLYHAAKLDANDGRVSYHLFTRKGVAQMYIAECNNFPDCTYDMSKDIDDPNKMELVRNTGKISIYDRKIEKTTAVFEQNKKVILIKCLDDGNDEQGYCEYDILVNVKGNPITLLEDENYAKYAIKGEEGKFRIDFKNAIKLSNVGVEIMVHSGEATFEGTTDLDLMGSQSNESNELPSVTKYILSNKVFINFELFRQTASVLTVKYKAIKNSFFTIKYVYDNSQVKVPFSNEIIYPGESYLVNIDPSYTSISLKMNNNRYKAFQPYMTNFFAINCEYKVTTKKTQTGETEIPFADGYAQDIMADDEGKIYKSEYYEYNVSLQKIEESNYNKKMCMLYVSGYQIFDMNYVTRYWIGNNINQQIIFNDNFLFVNMLYPIPDTSIDLVIYVNIIDKATYNVILSIDSENRGDYIKTEIITKSTPFYLRSADYKPKCKTDTFCNLLIITEFQNATELLPRTNHMVEITVREATKKGDYTDLRVPTYIQKGIAKVDFTTGDGYYYVYTDLGKNDQGDVTINFFRDYGEVYGRIVKKDQKDSAASDIEWMEMYRLPNSEWPEDRVHYDKYLKKYHINIEDTEDCIGGCYLILGIIISQIGEWAEEWKFYPFSIITEISQSSYGETTNTPITTIQEDEFIIGNVDISKNVKISQFYQVWLPRDSYQVNFDWQSELAGLYINIDDSKPTASNADFTLINNGTDGVLTITKEQIIKKAKEKKIKLPYEDSLEDVKLIIGIWTDKTDSADTELYSLKIHEVLYVHDDLDIIEVNTDQKILCKPRDLGGSDRAHACLFMVTYDDQDANQGMDLLVHAISTNKGVSSVMYANFINAGIYNRFDSDELRQIIPKESSEFNSITLDTNYFYIKLDNNRKGKYLFVNVITYSADDVMMVSSMNSFDETPQGVQVFYPSPRTEQIVQAKKDSLIVEFSGNSSLIVNIENLGGEADVRWEEDAEVVHYLRGKGDRLTLTTSTNYKRLLIKKLKSDHEIKGADPGFVFLVDFYKRVPSVNFDEVVYGSSIELGYRNTDLPIYLYSKKVDYSNDINIALTFRDSHIDTQGEYKSSPIEVRAFLDKRKTIYSAKLTPEFEPSENKVDGKYDPSIKTAQVFIPDLMINTEFNIDPKDFPTLLLFVGKSVDYKEKKYETFNVEAQFSKTNSLVIPIEKVYNYGKFYGLLTQTYKLRNDKNKKMIKIVLSFNGNLLDWAIGGEGDTYNTTKYPINAVQARGKIIVTITPSEDEEDFVFLNIFQKEGDDIEPEPKLQNYAFKYINVDKEEDFFDYVIFGNDGRLEYQEERDGDKITGITCTFNKIELKDRNQANITYFLKIADATNYIPHENFKTVSVTESPYYTKYIRNPQDQNNKITIKATGDFTHWCYIQVIAQIQQNKALEYVAYDGEYTEKNKPKESDSSDDKDDNGGGSSTTVLIVVSVVLVVFIIALGFVVFYFQQKNKSLMNKVKHVSFQNTNAPADPDLLLAKQNNSSADKIN